MIRSGRTALRVRLLGLLLAAGLGPMTGCGNHSSGPLAGGGITWTRITPAQAGPADRPDWRGDSIAFQTAAGGFVRIAASRKDGSGFAIYPAPPGANERAPRWVDSTLLVYSGDQIGTEDIW